ncbi:RNA 2',3'-cyclic phosphodiesterase [Streptomyces montanisoli]|uniref:RNA 2',3'-cyclic phosphodiesterase n=1 Tax=Streptomyces montanisoli TaxID=2798581 RepID=A0A940MLF8_9ACTN|nr:RNA 2',3'-cyclic phosphodiesterase [Streptomyces montanisoli]MBP0460623.1 RNA 2',3'-cyclic phosphodiesterase [Streptomyces montanisoli]
MRLFVAVLPPDDAVAVLARAVAPLRELPGAGGLRWTGRASWHFTLAFLGEVDGGVLPALDERLARAARRCEPFPLRISGGGRFGATTLWAGAAGGIPELRRLAERASAAARRAGAGAGAGTGDETAGGHRAFHPHLTLARARGGRGGADLRPYVAALEPVESTTWQVGEVCLVRSHLPDGRTPGEGPRYETLGRWPLGRGR